MRHNSEKIVTMTEQEMLNYWKTKLRLNPVRKGCIIEREDGIDLDEVIIQRMREWYANILATAPWDKLPIKDLTDSLNYTISPNLVVRVELPQHVIEPIEWKMESWKRASTTFYQPDCYMSSLQYNFYSRGRSAKPIMIRLTQHVIIYTAAHSSDTIIRALCTVRPTDGTYQLAESLLATVPHSL